MSGKLVFPDGSSELTNEMDMSSIDAPNLLHMIGTPGTFFSTGNLAEAAPGVHTPLGWSI
ncbi:hypothetical protein [Mycobacteroides abscessus]|uniref:hypothetical protein n=1 Tax=Mycobacteroides abscessus TaxID=36809 RepID=UPI0005DD2D31|nr:hypothetical protein [Mycobacteroides abscessus]CPS43641.1 Uncharacterised protein [Mycobacteroides abscessus]CPS45480.1 Uncharacterised protein [Mycobacteroides abscessus]CPS54532.1 Uncharacterised protein [Mycobacteroides abscessus]CPT37237.1 Uncharacterised protein [Mycobacteroides abscessus]CPT64321.1 Uncharacterised protein [Mycobacteroides abscessus]